MSTACRTWIIVLVGAGLLAGSATAWAQLTEADIAALRAQGEREGWTFTVGENPATQRPLEQLCGAVMPPDWKKHVRFDSSPPKRSLPASWDWRAHVTLPPVRDQGQCGSCWAFGAIGATECALVREANISVDLSEQWLVSCTGAGSCNGGWHTEALKYLTCGGKQDPCGGNGAVLESSFPYEAWDVPCGCPYQHPYCLDSWFVIGSEYTTPTTEQIKQAIYDHGPVAVCMYAGSWAFSAYTGGIFNACEDEPTDHVVVLVGWDDNQAGGVWFLRNSWGPLWGEGGYMRIKYGCCRVGEATAYVNYLPPDCNHNGIPDRQDISNGTSLDCNGNGIPDECEPQGTADCNTDGTSDLCDIYNGTSADCNANGIPDECEIADGSAPDCNANGIPDACELNLGYRSDDGSWDTIWGTDSGDFIWMNRFVVQAAGEAIHSVDLAWGWVPAGAPTTIALWRDPNGDSDPHDAQLLWKSDPVNAVDPMSSDFVSVPVPDVTVGAPGDVFFAGAYMHLTSPYYCYPALTDLSVFPGSSWCADGKNLEDLSADELYDLDDYGGGVFFIRAHATIPDCNGNGVIDSCDIADGTSPDINGNGRPDECDPDCNGNSVPDDVDIDQATSQDCNADGIPDECQTNLGVSITAQPVALTVCEGEPATFTVQAQGAGTLAYQWRHEDQPIGGATGSTFTLPSATLDDAGTYDVVVSSTCTSSLYPALTSTAALLTVNRVAILTQPRDQHAVVGDTVTFSVVADSPRTLTYQWRKDGRPIPGEVNMFCTVRAVTLADAGEYSVVVGGCNSVTSTAAALTVDLATPAIPSPHNGAEDVPVDVELRWDPVPEATRYEVNLGTDQDMTLSGRVTAAAWTPGHLDYATTYFWKVTAYAGEARTEGLIWWFVTEPAPIPPPGAPTTPYPPDGASGVAPSVQLSWNPASGADMYKVLLGESPALGVGSRLVSSTETCQTAASGLEAGKEYYWQVIAKNAGGQTVGPTWSFMTAESPAESNEPVDSNQPAPSEPNTPSENNAVPDNTSESPTRSGLLCPSASAALLAAMWLGLRGSGGRRSEGRGSGGRGSRRAG